MHAEGLELCLDGQCLGYLVHLGEVFAQSLLSPLVESRERLEGQPVLGALDQRGQAGEGRGEGLGAGLAQIGNMQLVEEIGEAGIAGELGVDLSLVGQLDTIGQQRFQHVTVVRGLEEVVDLEGHFRPDIGQIDQHLGQRLANALQTAQGARQAFGRLLTHLGNPQGEDEAGQRRLATGFDGG